ncbi:MAG TPA: trehalose-6-phosphate synthase [Acidimicrobiales bacterium]|nr:trehalose-6-phosphate synthase [Acidimicrobiales bacterium]
MTEAQSPPAEPSPLVVLSNRGPLSFSKDDDGRLQVRRAAGGLVVTLGPGVARAGARWIASAITEADREGAAQGVVESDGFRLQSLVIDPQSYQAYYNVVANGTLWYALHGLWDLPRRPRFDRRWFEAWDAYRRVNRRFAEAAAEAAAPGATVLVQDYQLALVPAHLAAARPDVRIGAFMHTPWCAAQELAALPDNVVLALLEGMAGATAVGFHSPRWASNFEDCCRQVLGRQPQTFVAPAAPDADDTLKVAAGDACRSAGAELDRRLGGRRLIVRVDRIELSKNILRGFHAYDELLEKRPDLRGGVVFGAFVYPSRQGLADYLAYGQEVQALAAWVNDKWATPGWEPVLMDPSDDYPRSVAALRRADVVLVNPVRDGLNLVAKEASLVNDRQGVLVLSRNAGCWEELGDASLVVNPFDVTATAGALEEALDMTPAERQERAAMWRKAVEARTPLDWFDEVLAAVGAD